MANTFNDGHSLTSGLACRSLQKKVNPELPVEIKPSNRARKLQEGKLRKQKQKAVLKRQRDDEQRWHLEMRSEGERGRSNTISSLIELHRSI